MLDIAMLIATLVKLHNLCFVQGWGVALCIAQLCDMTRLLQAKVLLPSHLTMSATRLLHGAEGVSMMHKHYAHHHKHASGICMHEVPTITRLIPSRSTNLNLSCSQDFDLHAYAILHDTSTSNGHRDAPVLVDTQCCMCCRVKVTRYKVQVTDSQWHSSHVRHHKC